jgi:hypothetical protein
MLLFNSENFSVATIKPNWRHANLFAIAVTQVRTLGATRVKVGAKVKRGKGKTEAELIVEGGSRQQIIT